MKHRCCKNYLQIAQFVAAETALVAFVRKTTEVKVSLVVAQILGMRERQAAQITHVVLLASVLRHVLAQVAFAVVHLAADVTRECLDVLSNLVIHQAVRIQTA